MPRPRRRRGAEARLAQGAQKRLRRTRIEAPFDGVVVAGDWSQAIGSPIEQGKQLFTLAPLTGYRVALKVDERDVRDMAPDQRGALVLAGLSTLLFNGNPLLRYDGYFVLCAVAKVPNLGSTATGCGCG